MINVEIDPAFAANLSAVNLTHMDESSDVIYIVDRAMKLRAFNAAWTHFALANNGAEILERWKLGTSLFGILSGAIEDYLLEGYEKAMREGTVFSYSYECSSPDVFRLFQQSAYSLHNFEGLVITNHQAIKKPHTEENVTFSKRFVDKHGIIIQCMNCRKIRDPNDKSKWFWVPELLTSPWPDTSHDICSPCLEHYYPDAE